MEMQAECEINQYFLMNEIPGYEKVDHPAALGGVPSDLNCFQIRRPMHHPTQH